MNEDTLAKVFWYTQKKPEQTEPLRGNIQAEVAVIGGGMAGLSCAESLHRAGIQTILIERDFCGAGASGKTSGFITPASEIELGSLVRTYGPEKAKRFWEFVLSGVEQIRSNIRRYDMKCDYVVQDSLFAANNASGFRHAESEHAARHQLGYESTLYDKDGISPVIGSSRYVGAVRYPKTFGMNSYLHCQHLKRHLIESGVLVFEQTPVQAIQNHTIATPGGTITADHIIVCTDRFIPEFNHFEKEIYHVQTFLGITKPLSQSQIKQIFPEKPLMVWDTDLVYNYFRVTGEGRLLIGGGDLMYTYAYNITDNMARFRKRLAAYVAKKFPELEFELEYVWPGMLGVSKDLLPIMGPDPDQANVWYLGAATGLPWAAALGNYAAEKITNGRSEFDEDFSPNRHFVINARLQSLLTTPVTYALSHGIAKYL